MALTIIIACIVLSLSFYVFAAFMKARALTGKRPVEYLLDERKRIPDYCPWDRISEEMKKYFILLEDPGFFKRRGTSLKNFIRRGFSYYFVKNRITHGSTVSQQLAKNLYLRFDKTIFRKITEYCICLKIERSLAKEEIFTFYLNIIYFGNDIYGISKASEYYFSKTPAELTANQAVFFACLIAGPNAADPVHYSDTFFRFRKGKLEKCFREGLITERELDHFLSFPEERPDPEFAPALGRIEKPPLIRMENERFGPFHSHEMG